MRCSVFCHVLVFVVVATCNHSIRAQGGGFGAGGGGAAAGVGYQHYNNPGRIFSANTGGLRVSGTAKINVKPQSLRLVLALTNKSETASQCNETIKTRIANIRRGMSELKIDEQDVVEDFIVVNRDYRWELKKQEKSQFLQEFEDGFRMQTNLHILCSNEEIALKAIEKAFANGVSEVVSFDYWHDDLDAYKTQALKKALESAKSKSEILLSVFDETPRVLNVDNSIEVVTPSRQYRSIKVNADNPNHPSKYISYWNSYNKLFIPRPWTTFYAGDEQYSDFSPKTPPMNPMISVVSKVTLTYESPTSKDQLDLQRRKIETGGDDDDD